MSNRTKILRTLLLLGVVACVAGAGVFSAFSSQTDNPGNVVTAGTVTLEDNDGGSALYTMSAAKPGESSTPACIKVTYTGSLAATVKLYTPSTIGELGPSVILTIEPGSGGGAFPSCSGFTPDAGGPLYEGTLSAFAAEHNSYANGLTDFPGSSATKWETNDSVVYRVTATLSASAPDSAQGKTTGAHVLRWEAQNQ
jgi:predicted ribosomally synthesized peptide with SipW-like signal peptide